MRRTDGSLDSCYVCASWKRKSISIIVSAPSFLDRVVIILCVLHGTTLPGATPGVNLFRLWSVVGVCIGVNGRVGGDHFFASVVKDRI